jgi:hypothetical protein
MALPEILTVEDLFNSPVRAGASISPDGTKIAYLAPWRNRLNIWVRSVDSFNTPVAALAQEDDARCVTADSTRSVFNYQWTTDPRWLLYTQDTGGDENWHVYRVDLENPGAAAVDLTPFPGAKTYFELPAGRPGKAIVGLNKRDAALFDAYELDIATGQLTLLAENPGNGASWFSGRNGELFTLAVTAEGDVDLSSWDATTGTLRRIALYDGVDYTLGSSRSLSRRTGKACGSAPTGTPIAPCWPGWTWPPVRRRRSTATRHSAWTRGHMSGPPCPHRSSSASGRVNCLECAISVSDR